MTSALRFEIDQRCHSTGARAGRVHTVHGTFDTPAFMPVGTRGTIKGLTPDQIEATGTQILLNNAYHLMLRPGADLVGRRGGVHEFMRWHRPILTDSGGYQAFSMADINDIDDDGVTFRSIIDGARIRLTPERAIEVQNELGADIIMAFDDCPPSVDSANDPAARNGPARRIPPIRSKRKEGDHAVRRRLAHERTVRWLQRCRAAHRRPAEQSLFGIVQGGLDLELRAEAVEAICNIELPGYAIGGVAVGEGPDLIGRVVEFTAPRMPADKPRYLMGVGYERDIVRAVRAGVDMFDCVLPTRNGRSATAFTRYGRLQLRNASHREDDSVLEAGCPCYTCVNGFSRAYLRHLFLAGEMLGPILVSLHNIQHFQRLMLDIRRAIREDAWSWLMSAWPVTSPDSESGQLDAGSPTTP